MDTIRGSGLVDKTSPTYDRLVNQADLVITQNSNVDYGDYPAQRFTIASGKKEGNSWGDNPWSDRIESPLGNIHDLDRFLDKHYYLDILVVFNQGEMKLIEGTETIVKNEIRFFPASSYTEFKPTIFKFKVFEADGTTPIVDATAVVRCNGRNIAIEYDAEEEVYSGEVYGIGKGTLTVSKVGFIDHVETYELSYNMVYGEVLDFQDDETEVTNVTKVMLSYTPMEIVMVAED